jgi:acyl-CoA synthetase (AMP-forming)/AMP-acid ligase II
MNNPIRSPNERMRDYSRPLGASTIGEVIRARAQVQPGHPAIESSGHAPFSYGELQVLIDEVRSNLRLRGFDRNAKIAVAMPSGPQAALAIIAVTCSAVSVPVNLKQTERELETLFTGACIDAVLIMNEHDSPVRRAAARGGALLIDTTPAGDGTVGFRIGSSIGGVGGKATAWDPDEDTPAFILQTSGTAAKPKLIPFSHRNMLAAAARLQAWFDLTPQDRCLSVSPPFYSHGLKVTVFTPLLTGGTIVFPADAGKFDYQEWFSLLKPTWYSAGPTLHRLIFDQLQFIADEERTHSLRFVLSGGAPLSENVLIGLQKSLGTPVVEHYGSSEAAQIAANLPSPGPSKLGTCGIPWPDTLKIVGQDGDPVLPGEQGEISLGGPTVISGYLGTDELNRARFADGWFRTGDIGSLDSDGFLTLHGRMDDLINRGAEKISPIEVDEVLARHPAVAEAAAFAVPHPRLGQDIAAAVVFHPGLAVSAGELRHYLQERLASYKVPRRIAVLDQLPKGRTGKVLRRELSSFVIDEPSAEATETPQESESTSLDEALISQLTELWQRLLQHKSITLDDDFLEKGGDSLLAAQMLSEVEIITGQTIPSHIVLQAHTIRQLARKILELDIRPKPLVRLNADGKLKPLFLFHGDYLGGGLYSARLARLLGANQPLFAVAPHDLGKDEIVLPIEQIAAEQLTTVLQAQPNGPYQLSGYCFGGLVAFEVARMLIAAGKEVEFVAIIDSPTINGRRSIQLILLAIKSLQPIFGTVALRLASHLWHKCSLVFDRSSSISLAHLSAWLARRIRKYFIGKADHPGWRYSVVPPDQEFRLRQLFGRYISDRRSNVDMLSQYIPKPLSVSVLFFEAEFSAKPWQRISPDVVTMSLLNDLPRAIADRHTEVVRNTRSLAKMANTLRARLSATK